VVDTSALGPAVLGTIAQQETADGQGVFKRLHELLSFGMKHTDSLDLERKAATCSMMNTGLTAQAFYLKLMAYKVSLADMGIHQSEEKTLIPRFKKGLSTAYVEVVRLLEGQMLNKPKNFKTLEQVASFVRIHGTRTGIAGVTCSKADKRFQGSAATEIDQGGENPTEKVEKSRSGKGGKGKAKAAKAAKKELKEVKLQMAQMVNRAKTDCRNGNKCKKTDCGFKHPRSGKSSGSRPDNPHPVCEQCKHKHTVGWCGKCWTCGGDHFGRDCPVRKVKSQGSATVQPESKDEKEAGHEGAGTVMEDSTEGGVRTITISQLNSNVTRRGWEEPTKVSLIRKTGWFSELLDKHEQNEPEWEFNLPTGAQGALFNLVECYTKTVRKDFEGEFLSVQKPQQSARESQSAKHDGPNRKRRRQVLKNKRRMAQKEKKRRTANNGARRLQPRAPKRKVTVKRDRLYRTKQRLFTRRYGTGMLCNMKWWNMDERNFKGADGFKTRYKKRADAARQLRVRYNEYQQLLRNYRSSCLASQAKEYRAARANRVGKRVWMQRMSKITNEMRHLFHAPSHTVQVNWREKWVDCGWNTRSEQPSPNRVKVLTQARSLNEAPMASVDYNAWAGLTAKVGEELLRAHSSSKSALWQAMAVTAGYYKNVVVRQLGDLFECVAVC
jgi:hypothetical protein